MSSLDNFARASLNQALAWIMTGRRIRQGQRRAIAESIICSADYQRGREKLKYALRDSGLSAWGIEQGKDEYSEISADCWTDESKIDYFNSALEFSVYCMGYSEIYVQTDELVNRFPVSESERSKNPLEFSGEILAGCLPQVSPFDRSSPPGEYFVVEAIERIGKELFLNEWTGQERDIYQNGYCWIDGVFSNLLAYDTPDMLLYSRSDPEAGLVKPYWPLFKDNSEQEYFSYLYGLLEPIHPRLKKDSPLPQYAQDFIEDLKDNWPEIKDKAKSLKYNFRQVRNRWDQAFDELIARVGDNARFFDFNGMNDAISVPKDKWSSGMSYLYRGGLQTGLIYRQCYKTLGLPENGAWAVLVSESVLSKSDNFGVVKEKKKPGPDPSHDWDGVKIYIRKYLTDNGLPNTHDYLAGLIMEEWQKKGLKEPTLSKLRRVISEICKEFKK